MAPLEETVFNSADGSHILEISPQHGTPGYCAARLSRSGTNGTTVLWKRHLINNYAPLRIFVGNSGTSVVTLDEWDLPADWQSDFPLVIYGHNGKLVHAFNYSDFTNWDRHAIAFFGPRDRCFFVRPDAGSLLMIDLSDGEIMDSEWFDLRKGWAIREDEWQEMLDFGCSNLLVNVEKTLLENDAYAQCTAIRICAQEGYRQMIPILRKLLSAPTTYVYGSGEPVYMVRKAAKEALLALGVTDLRETGHADDDRAPAAQDGGIEQSVGGDSGKAAADGGPTGAPQR